MKILIFLSTLLFIFVGLTLTIPSPIHDPEGKRGPNGLLPLEESGKAGQKLAETFKTIIDSTADLILIYLNSNPQATKILENNPKVVEFILSTPEVVKYSINHPNAKPQDIIPPEMSQFVEKIYEIVGTDMSLMLEKALTLKDSKKRDFQIITHPTIKNLLSSPYIIEFIANFPFDLYAFPKEPNERRNLLKLLVENPEKGIEEIDKNEKNEKNEKS